MNSRLNEPIGRDPPGACGRRGRRGPAESQSLSPMHTLNLSGLATYVNRPEIWSGKLCCVARLAPEEECV